MLMSMRAQVEAARALAYVAAAASDAGHHHADEAIRKANQACYEFLVPIVKGWSTEMAVEVTSTGVQVHGGIGATWEAGIHLHMRRARALAVEQGTAFYWEDILVNRILGEVA